MSDLDQAVAAVVSDCLGIREGESALVVCNPATLGLGERLRGEAGRAGADAVLAMMAERRTHGSEPPQPIAAAMAAADVVLCPTEQSLSHTAARRHANEAGARIATLPGVTEGMLARVMSADMAELRRRGDAVAAALDGADEAHITCRNGSDLRLSLKGRPGLPDNGDIRDFGAFGNLPCGEGFISPHHDAGDGTLVIDGTLGSLEKVTELCELRIEAGQLVSAAGSQGEALLELLRGAGEDGTRIAELGIGTNERAIVTGNLLEDEKILGSCHVAFGASAGIGGEIQVPIHEDCVVLKPSVTLDGEPLIRDGELLV